MNLDQRIAHLQAELDKLLAQKQLYLSNPDLELRDKIRDLRYDKNTNAEDLIKAVRQHDENRRRDVEGVR
jgi:hypothetical protein